MDDGDARTPWAVWPSDSRMPLDEAAMALDAGTSDNRLTVVPTEE